MDYPAIRQFLKPPSEGGAYTDERLSMLLAHAEDRRLSWRSCCCLVGASNATHALLSADEWGGDGHYIAAHRALGETSTVELEFIQMGWHGPDDDSDANRRAKLIPLIKAEMERRASQRSEVNEFSYALTHL